MKMALITPSTNVKKETVEKSSSTILLKRLKLGLFKIQNAMQ